MTVKELIEKLKELPDQEIEVFYWTAETVSGLSDLDEVILHTETNRGTFVELK